MDAGKGLDRQIQKSAVSTQPAACSKVLEGNSTKTSEKIQTKAVNSWSRNYTHFVSLPLVYPGLVEKLIRFKNRITTELGIDETVFNKLGSLHLTVRMLELGSEGLLKKATEVLQSVSPKLLDALDNRPVFITLKGLDLMRGSKEEAFIIYAPVEEIGGEGRLLRACQVITDALVDAGLAEKDAEYELKLHVTLMNAAFKRRERRSDEVVPFDARGIFEWYDCEKWGEFPIREAHLSQRGKFDENGYFHCCASIPFPQHPNLP
ncbi:hypothetical protein C2S51_004099 [Perilla frutescens var. frutescens]|nr:hypothetical protein C2S51_004099 [Perilla frutescens var. frutescens]